MLLCNSSKIRLIILFHCVCHSFLIVFVHVELKKRKEEWWQGHKRLSVPSHFVASFFLIVVVAVVSNLFLLLGTCFQIIDDAQATSPRHISRRKKPLSEDDWRFDLISAVTSSNDVDTRLRPFDADTRSISGQYTRTEMKRRRSRSRYETHVSYHPRSLPVTSIRYCYEFVSLSLHKSRRKEIVIMSAIILSGSAHSKCTRLVLFYSNSDDWTSVSASSTTGAVNISEVLIFFWCRLMRCRYRFVCLSIKW